MGDVRTVDEVEHASGAERQGSQSRSWVMLLPAAGCVAAAVIAVVLDLLF